MRISVPDLCGHASVSRADGEKLRHEIERVWPTGEVIELDFGNLRIASVSFLDEGIAVLARRIPLDTLRERLRFIDMTGRDRALLDERLRERAREYRSDLGRVRGHR